MTSSMSEYVTLADGVLTITIATPAKGASLDFAGVNAGSDALEALDPSVGAILVQSTGANFCAGGDVRAFAEAAERGKFIHGLATDLHRFVRLLHAAPVPVVAGVQGWAAGAGMSLVCVLDIAIGGPSTNLRSAYAGIGLSPDGGQSWSLPRIVGPARARELMMTNAPVGAAEAVRLGLLSRLVDAPGTADGAGERSAVAAEAAKVAATLATGPRSTYAAIRRLVAESAEATLAAQLDAEADAIAAAADSPTGREGVDAFVAKRTPNFTG